MSVAVDKKTLKKTLLFLAAFFMLLFSLIAIVHESTHEEFQHDCKICEMIHQVEEEKQRVKPIVKTSYIPVISSFIIVITIFFRMILTYFFANTPITHHVRMNH